MESDGRVTVIVFNAANSNNRKISTYQSLPLNKKTTIAVTWTSGTVTISFDGISVPVAAAVTGGTAPTTAGTGGDFSIGRAGAAGSFYAPGYISNVGVFDAVLSAATIKDHSTRKLTGSETNCIGAWSLDNTAVNQKSPGTNDLTATGGVGYTATSPHGQLGNGVEINKAVALVMSCTYSTDTTMVVQCPEGVTIPTTGGISSVEFSTQANPFGWVSDKGRWAIVSLHIARNSASATSGVVYDKNIKLTVPIGSFTLGYNFLFWSGTATNAIVELSTSTTVINVLSELSARNYVVGSTDLALHQSRQVSIDLTSQTIYTLLCQAVGSSPTNFGFLNDFSPGIIKATPSSL